VTSLDQAEEDMLALTCERAGLVDGQDILELGCGWGSLTLWMAEKFPGSRITAVSNSRTQREHILARCAERGFANVEIITCDVNQLALDKTFDRVVSVEMFEHVRNYEQLFERIAGWLRPGGALFVHIFCHGTTPYTFEVEGDDNWMGRYFFTGGIMPSDDLFYHFQKHLAIEEHWRVDGTHYQRTARGWLDNMDARRAQIMPVLAAAYGDAEAQLWFGRWRMFFMACEELWGWNGGTEWWVSHYRFRRKA
jgi:cyclopropane-fatty-acyl-phospholipid synthase